MSASILPDDAVFSQFRTLCSSTDNWGNKYDKNGMQVWVEVPPVVSEAQKNAAKIHMIKVGTIVPAERRSPSPWPLSIGPLHMIKPCVRISIVCP